MPLYIIDRYNKSLHLHTCIVVFLTPIHCSDRQPYVLRAEANASRHPPPMCFTCSTGRERYRWRRRWEREKRKGGEKKGDLSEACVRGIPCWCQFHSSSSMLRSFSLPQRDQLVLWEREREGEIRVVEIIERQVQVEDEIEKRKKSDGFANIAFHAAVMSNYMPRKRRVLYVQHFHSTKQQSSFSIVALVSPVTFYLVCSLQCTASWNGESLIVHNIKLRAHLNTPGSAVLVQEEIILSRIIYRYLSSPQSQ